MFISSHKMLEISVWIFLAFHSQSLADATHCYECTDIPHLRDCGIVRQCNSHEECFIEQLVTTSGHVVFNSGCRDRMDCARLAGRSIGAGYNVRSNVSVGSDTRVVNMVRRADVSVCEQCCDTDYCNNQGCYDVATPLSQRGPYCFNCQRQSQLESCRHVTQCDQDQMCLIEKRHDSGLTVYDSHCIDKLQCDAIRKTYQLTAGRRSQRYEQQLDGVSSPKWSIMDLVQLRRRQNTQAAMCILCCETDFCNNNCIRNV